ncbi:MAG: DNA-binding response regulator [Acidobacteria bacterium]|nr:MAG: DNA-binding response regulator [Acidobacteriota bacterium]
MKKRILIIEDDKDIVEAVRYNLEKERGFSVLSAKTGDEGLNLVPQMKPHLIILDIGLPGLTGYEVCRMLRRDAETQDIPIVMLTARGSESDKVLGLELGADDYITKPFGIRELIARVRAAIRRKEADSGTLEVFDDGKLYIHFEDYIIRFHGREPKLTFKEFSLLKLLVQNAGRVLSRDKILDAVWGYNYYSESRTVDVHIRRIRKKLGPGAQDYIDTVIGVGYRFKPQNPESQPSPVPSNSKSQATSRP